MGWSLEVPFLQLVKGLFDYGEHGSAEALVGQEAFWAVSGCTFGLGDGAGGVADV